jgi:glucose dehydrogenase
MMIPQRLRSKYLAIAASSVGVIAVLVALAIPGAAQQQRAAGDWPNITGSDAGTRYSAVDQINASNFNTLKVAWEWRGVKDAGVNLGSAAR